MGVLGIGQEPMLRIGETKLLILQTLQQLRDVYGDSVDKIVQGNTSNIIFLKSTDSFVHNDNKCVVMYESSMMKSSSKSWIMRRELSGKVVCNDDPSLKAEVKVSVKRNG